MTDTTNDTPPPEIAAPPKTPSGDCSAMSCYAERIALERGYRKVREGYRVRQGDVTLGAAVQFLENEIAQYSHEELKRRAKLRIERGEYEVTFGHVPTGWEGMKIGESHDLFMVVGVYRRNADVEARPHGAPPQQDGF